MKTILIAPNNFKESISAAEASRAIRQGVLAANGKMNVVCLPLSDGGEGFVDALMSATGGNKIICRVSDPLGRKIVSYYTSIDDKTVVIEMALASGLELLAEDEKNPLLTSSYGTGELISDALNRGYKKVVLGIGGSATNDAGMGLLQALSANFYDEEGTLIQERGARVLSKVHSVNTDTFLRLVSGIDFVVACDVTNPLLGPNGATFIYGPQKGADRTTLGVLEGSVFKFSEISNKVTGKDKTNSDGAGAAGGIGYALMTYMGAVMKPGFDIVAEYVDLENQVKEADLVITGEGKIDHQTAQGKVIARLAWLCQMHNKPLIAIGGVVDLDRPITGVKSYHSIISEALDKEDAMKNAGKYLETIGKQIVDSNFR